MVKGLDINLERIDDWDKEDASIIKYCTIS